MGLDLRDRRMDAGGGIYGGVKVKCGGAGLGVAPTSMFDPGRIFSSLGNSSYEV